MGGSDTTQTTQSQSVTQLPPWINQAAQQNYAQAQNVANQPLQQYQGQMVADVSPQMQQAWNLAATGGNAGADQYNASQAAYMGVLANKPQQVKAGFVTPTTISADQVKAQQLANTNLAPYMDPYTQSVINATLPILQQNLGIQQIGNQSQAAGAGAYGGSRQAIQQGVTQAQGALGMAQMAAQLNQANFGQAQAAAIGDITRNLAAAQGNQSANLTAAQANQNTALQGGEFNVNAALQAALANQSAQQNQMGLNLQAAGGLGALGQQAQLSQARNFTELMTAGAAEQQQQQNVINANMAKFAQAQGYPAQQLGVLESALGMTPYGQATQGQQVTQTQTSANPLGMVGQGLGALGSMFSMMPIGSDRRLKTDIAKVGRHPAGVNMYAYRYKGDPKSYPKVVGPMAEDVAKIAPHAVSTIPGSGGRRAVNMGALSALSGPLGALGSPRPALTGPPGGPNMPRLGPLGAPQGPLNGPTMPRPPRMRSAQPRGALAFG